MWDMNEVTAIEYRGRHVYRIRFDDGLEADVDLSAYVDSGPVFAPLADLGFFRKARIEGGTIAWPNGADIAPETLYGMVEKVAQKAMPRTSRRCRMTAARPLKRVAHSELRSSRR
jgi:hypothetical protein